MQPLYNAFVAFIAMLTIVTLGTEEAYEVVDRKALYRWLLSLKDEETKAFRVQHDGEIDTRGLYTVLAVASICNMLTPELVEGLFIDHYYASLICTNRNGRVYWELSDI